MVPKEILRARAFLRDEHLKKINKQDKQNKITFDVIYHPVFRDVRKIFKELHVILASDNGHTEVFFDVPMIGYKNNKNLKAHLVRSHNYQTQTIETVWRKRTSFINFFLGAKIFFVYAPHWNEIQLDGMYNPFEPIAQLLLVFKETCCFLVQVYLNIGEWKGYSSKFAAKVTRKEIEKVFRS